MQQNEEPSDFGQARQNLITEIEQVQLFLALHSGAPWVRI